MMSSRKKVSINRTPGRGLICIFSKWLPMKPLMYYWLFMVDFISIYVLATNRKIGFLNRFNIFSSAYDERWRNYNVHDVILTLKPETGGKIYLRLVVFAKSQLVVSWMWELFLTALSLNKVAFGNNRRHHYIYFRFFCYRSVNWKLL